MNIKNILFLAIITASISSFSLNYSMEANHNQDNVISLAQDADFFTFLDKPTIDYLITFVPYADRAQFIKTLLGNSHFKGKQRNRFKDEISKIKLGEAVIDACKDKERGKKVIAAVVVGRLQEGAKVNVTDEEGNTPLMITAQAGDLDLVQILCAFGADVNKKNNVGNTALMLAAENGHRGVVEYLVNTCKASVNQQNNDGNTALMIIAPKLSKAFVAHKSFDQLAPFLVKSCTEEIDLSIQNQKNQTITDLVSQDTLLGGLCLKPLIELEKEINEIKKETQLEACASKKQALLNSVQINGMYIHWVLQFKAQLAEQLLDWRIQNDVDNNQKALSLACAKGKCSIVQKLINRGANPSIAPSPDQPTPLMQAVSDGYLNVVKLLLENGADPNAIDNINDPLFRAVANGDIEMIKLLIQYEAKVRHEERESLCDHLLIIAVEENKKHPQLVQLIYKYSPLGSLTNKIRSEVLTAAAEYNCPIIIKKLTEEKIRIDAQEFNKLLSTVSRANVSEVIMALLDYNDEITQYTENDGVSFHMILIDACFNNNIDLATYMLDRGANPDVTCSWTTPQQGEDDETIEITQELSPLSIAIKDNNLPLAKLLLKYEANPNQKVDKTDLLILASGPRINSEMIDLIKQAVNNKKK